MYMFWQKKYRIRYSTILPEILCLKIDSSIGFPRCQDLRKVKDTVLPIAHLKSDKKFHFK